MSLAPRIFVLLMGAMAGAALSLAQAQTVCSSNPARFEVNGAEVLDTRTGLTWQRCSSGQSFSGGTCSGKAKFITLAQAFAHAQANAGEQGWRLPNMDELLSLADGVCRDPAVDSIAFPATPSSWYWSSSPHGNSNVNAWIVHAGSGDRVEYGFHKYSFVVRLVRASR